MKTTSKPRHIAPVGCQEARESMDQIERCLAVDTRMSALAWLVQEIFLALLLQPFQWLERLDSEGTGVRPIRFLCFHQ